MPRQIILQHTVSLDKTHGFDLLSYFPQAVTLPFPTSGCS